MPTIAHWYDVERLKLPDDGRDRPRRGPRNACPTVRDFIGQFRGLSGTAKQNAICNEIGVAERETLADFYERRADCGGAAAHGDAARVAAGEAPRSRRDRRKPSSGAPDRRRLRAERAFVYRKAEIEHDGLPYVIEVAFGYRPGDDEPSTACG